LNTDSTIGIGRADGNGTFGSGGRSGADEKDREGAETGAAAAACCGGGGVSLHLATATLARIAAANARLLDIAQS
jgi:hypothetical protein